MEIRKYSPTVELMEIRKYSQILPHCRANGDKKIPPPTVELMEIRKYPHSRAINLARCMGIVYKLMAELLSEIYGFLPSPKWTRWIRLEFSLSLSLSVSLSLSLSLSRSLFLCLALAQSIFLCASFPLSPSFSIFSYLKMHIPKA